MSESYKIHEDGLYFVTFSIVGWLDVFIRREYQEILIDSIQYCQKNKGFKLYCYCIMPSHFHMIAQSENGSLSSILRDLKSFTAKELIKSITENYKESRKELLLHQFKYFGSFNKNVEMQFWHHDNHPFYLYSDLMIQQKQNYIHQNPVKAGFVDEAQNWRLSSANPESLIKVLLL